MNQDTFVVCREGTSPETLTSLNHEAINVYNDEQWEDKKMDEVFPLIVEWKLNYLRISNYLITKHIPSNLN